MSTPPPPPPIPKKSDKYEFSLTYCVLENWFGANNIQKYLFFGYLNPLIFWQPQSRLNKKIVHIWNLLILLIMAQNNMLNRWTVLFTTPRHTLPPTHPPIPVFMVLRLSLIVMCIRNISYYGKTVMRTLLGNTFTVPYGGSNITESKRGNPKCAPARHPIIYVLHPLHSR